MSDLQWQWEENDGTFKDFENGQNRIINRSGNIVHLDTRYGKYTLNKVNMTQTNDRTNNIRKIKIKGYGTLEEIVPKIIGIEYRLSALERKFKRAKEPSDLRRLMMEDSSRGRGGGGSKKKRKYRTKKR